MFYRSCVADANEPEIPRHRTCIVRRMIGVNQDLDAHKLAVQLRQEIFRLSSCGAASRDYKFVAQIRDSARGGPRNIAEGFSRFAPAEFRKFLSYAKASLDETKNHIDDGRDSGYFSDEECDPLLTLAKRAIAAISGLMRYLESPAAMRAYEALRQAQRENPHTPRTRKQKTRQNPRR